MNTGDVVKLEDGTLGVVYCPIYEYLGYNSERGSTCGKIVAYEGVTFDGKYWRAKKCQINKVANSVNEYNSKIFHHPV